MIILVTTKRFWKTWLTCLSILGIAVLGFYYFFILPDLPPEAHKVYSEMHENLDYYSDKGRLQWILRQVKEQNLGRYKPIERILLSWAKQQNIFWENEEFFPMINLFSEALTTVDNKKKLIQITAKKPSQLFMKLRANFHEFPNIETVTVIVVEHFQQFLDKNDFGRAESLLLHYNVHLKNLPLSQRQKVKKIWKDKLNRKSPLVIDSLKSTDTESFISHSLYIRTVIETIKLIKWKAQAPYLRKITEENFRTIGMDLPSIKESFEQNKDIPQTVFKRQNEILVKKASDALKTLEDT